VAELGISKYPNGGGRLACLLILYQPRLALQSQQSLKFCCHGLQLFRVLLSREGFDEGANTLFVLESQHNASIRAASGGGHQGGCGKNNPNWSVMEAHLFWQPQGGIPQSGGGRNLKVEALLADWLVKSSEVTKVSMLNENGTTESSGAPSLKLFSWTLSWREVWTTFHLSNTSRIDSRSPQSWHRDRSGC
jgi:hypothetical protein